MLEPGDDSPMRIASMVAAAALVALAAACGQGDNQNVMVPQATPLTQAQVDRALGPELEGSANAAEQTAVEEPASEAPPSEAPRQSRPAPPPAEEAPPEQEPPLPEAEEEPEPEPVE